MFFDQLIVAAALNDTSLFQDNDAVAVAHGRETVRNHERGASRHQLIHTVLHNLFGAGIDGTCRFIQNQNRWIGDGSSRDGKQLALALA